MPTESPQPAGTQPAIPSFADEVARKIEQLGGVPPRRRLRPRASSGKPEALRRLVLDELRRDRSGDGLTPASMYALVDAPEFEIAIALDWLVEHHLATRARNRYRARQTG